MSRSTLDTRCSAKAPCRVCGAFQKCSSGPADTGTGSKFMCRGVPRSADWVPVKHTGHADFVLYRHQEDLDRDRQSYHYRRTLGFDQPRPTKVESPKPVIDWTAIARGHVAQITEDLRYDLAERLGVPRSVFDAVALLGYSREPIHLLDGEPVDPGFWVTPETDHTGNVIGLERRWRKEQKSKGEDKKAYPDCNRGLVLPLGWRERSGPVLNVEGFSCVMAATAAGLCATSRPGTNAGIEHLVSLYRDWPRDRDIIIVGENDDNRAGIDGAISIATQLAEQLERAVKWSLPPAGRKDSRDWLKDGGPWSELSWAERGAKLLAHLVANAVTVGAKIEPVAVAPTTATATATPEPPARAVAPTLTTGPSAAKVSTSIRELLTSTCRCEHPRILIGKRPSSGRRGAVPFGCHKNACPVCGLTKRRNLFDASEAYVERLTDPAMNDGAALTVYMTVVPSASNAALKRAVERKGGKYLAIDTIDPVGVSQGITDPEVSHLGHEFPGSTCLNSDTSADAETHTLWTVLLPSGKTPPRAAEFVQVTEADSMLRAWGKALLTTPEPKEGTTRFRFWRASRAWGEKIEKPIGDFKPEGVAVYTQYEIRKFVEELRVVSEFWFADPKVQGRPVGWKGCPASSLCISLLLRGVESTHRYSIDRVTEIAREWLDWIPEGIGDGWRVEQVLRSHLWLGPPTDTITDDLRRADEQDRAEEAAQAEASSLLSSLREYFRGREHEARGVVAELLA